MSKSQYNRVESHNEKKFVLHFPKAVACCPSAILEDARRSRDLNQLFFDDPRANEFIKLDPEINVDKDNEGIKQFEEKMFNGVVSLCDLIRDENDGYNFTVIPCGSFPLNAKVENLDEFDYVLGWENKSEFYKMEDCIGSRQIIEIESSKVSLGERYYIMALINRILIRSTKEIDYSDIKSFRKKRAINIKFSWMCSLSHEHSVSLDLAISVKTSSAIGDHFSYVKFPLKETAFEDSININEKMYWNCSVKTIIDEPNTNMFDKKMFETCNKISPNIRLCYRILK